LSGASIPLAFFPEKARLVLSYLPFRAVYDIPLSILLGKSGSDTWEGLAQLFALQIVWMVVLTLAGNLFWNQAVKKVTVNGG
jgi:ABC-2 type transport system permease protein